MEPKTPSKNVILRRNQVMILRRYPRISIYNKNSVTGCGRFFYLYLYENTSKINQFLMV